MLSDAIARTGDSLSERFPMTTNLVWMDLEMTGLDLDRHVIIEIATVVTDADLDILAEGPSLAIRQSESALAAMDDWNVEHHTASGLLERIRREGVLLAEAEAQTLAFIEGYVGEGESPLCGNSIWQDRRFLVKYMPTLEGYLYYRNIDVSSVKELARLWRPQLLAGVHKTNAHVALLDIRESIDELRFYRERFFSRF